MGANRISTSISILAAVLTALFVTTAAAETNSLKENPVRFAILGDRTGGPHPGVYEQIVTEAERLKPEFVVTVGDMIVGYTTDTAELASRWREFEQIVKPLSVPIYYTAGNNDITYDVAESVYRRFAGEPNQSFDYRGLHFTILDNSRWESSGELPEGYLSWLENDLKAHRDAAYTFVFMHKPFWYKTTLQGFPDTLHTLFKAYGVDAVITGHFHQYLANDIDGIHYVSLGSSGGDTSPDVVGPRYHFAWVTVDDRGIHLAPIAYNAVYPEDVVTGEEYVLETKFKYVGMECVNPAPISEDMTIPPCTVFVEVNNLNSSIPVDDTLRWEFSEGWTIEPAALPVKLTPGDSGQFAFEVSSVNAFAGSLPEMSLSFPLREGRSHTVSRPLHIARQAACIEADGGVKLDGKLQEKCWRAAETRLQTAWEDAAPAEPTSFYFAFDRDNLYLAARCEDSQIDSLRAEVEDHDGPVYSEDCVGYFIQPDLSKRVVYQTYFNPVGAVYDVMYKPGSDSFLNNHVGWNGVYEIGSSRDAEGWTLEVKIPLEQFGVAAESGQRWGINFRRKQPRLGSAADWQNPIDSDPQTLGEMVLR